MFHGSLFKVLLVCVSLFEALPSSIDTTVIAPKNDSWRFSQDMSISRMLHPSVYAHSIDAALIVGGCCTTMSIDGFFVSNDSMIKQGDMSTTRAWHTADYLPDGLVLIVGFPTNPDRHRLNSSNSRCSADLYDPQTMKTYKTAKMHDCRSRHTSSVIKDKKSTKVLIVGGSGDSALNSGEVFHGKNGSFYRVNNTMLEPRQFHTSTALPTGDVIIAGGCDDQGNCWDTLILYNSQSNRFYPLPARLSTKRASHTATYIPSIESILFVSSGTFDLFYVPTLTFISNGTTIENRQEHTATLLLDDRVLITGGSSGLATCEIYDPVRNLFIPAANMSQGRYWHSAILLPKTGEVLVCGGRNLGGLYYTCEIYTP